MKDIKSIISRLENEIKQTQKDLVQAESLSRLKEIAKVYKGEDKLVSFEKIADRIRNEKEEVKFMSGFGGLDNLLKGFRPQQLIVVSALTGSGKTSFLMDMTGKMKEMNPLWLPFEEGAEELVRKFLERGEEPPRAFTPDNMTSSTLEWIESKIVESIAKFDTKIVFIDQLDFIVPMKGSDHHLNVGLTMRTLKDIAKKWHVVIFIICHLTKAKMADQPTIEDLKGSSSIGQEADSVILLWRKTKQEGKSLIVTDDVNVSVQKNRRHGKTGNVKMQFENGHFIEYDWEHNEPKEEYYKTKKELKKDYDNFTE